MAESETGEDDIRGSLGSVLAKYLKLLLEAAELEDRSRSYTYRGQRDSAWPLQSAAVRRLESFGQSARQQHNLSLSDRIVQYTQHHLLREFRNRGFDIVDGRRQSVLECLSTLQHQGAATPLLDFSYSPLVALWFASESSDPETDGKIFKIDVTVYQTGRNEDATGHEATFEEILDGLRYPREILAWQPPGIGDSSRRALAQQSVLLLYKPHTDHLSAVGDRHFKDITVVAAEKEPLREDLRAAGVTASSLFPDLAGFAGANRPEASIKLPDHHGFLSQANAAYNDRNPDLAADFYQRYLDIYPDDNEVKLLFANAIVDAGQFRDAHKLLSEIELWATTELPDTAKSNFYHNKANAEAALGNHQNAISNYTKSLQLDSRSAARFNRANSYASMGRYSEAIADYDQCQGYAAAKFNSGNAHVAIFEYEGATTCFVAAAHMQPGIENYQTNRNTIVQVRTLIDGKQYGSRRGLIGASVHPGIVIRVEHGGVFPSSPTYVFPLAGNVGNTGNAGYRNLQGGEGFDGMIGSYISVVFVQEAPSDEERFDQ